MPNYRSPSELRAENPWPVCCLEITLAVVEPHSADDRPEIQGYLCDACGPVKSLVVLRSSPRSVM
jgi:hypothetical protein